jgi:hypothetical protein
MITMKLSYKVKVSNASDYKPRNSGRIVRCKKCKLLNLMRPSIYPCNKCKNVQDWKVGNLDFTSGKWWPPRGRTSLTLCKSWQPFTACCSVDPTLSYSDITNMLAGLLLNFCVWRISEAIASICTLETGPKKVPPKFRQFINLLKDHFMHHY